MTFNSIREVLSHMRERHSDKSLGWIAKKVGHPSSTLRRIETGEVSKPTYSTARNICAIAISPKDSVSLLKKEYPSLSSYIEKDFKIMKKVQESENEGLVKAYHDYRKWQLLNLASIKEVSKETIEDLGAVYKVKAQQLVDDGYLQFQNGSYKCTIDLGYWIDSNTLMSSIGFVYQSLKDKIERGNSDKGGLAYYEVRGWSEKGKAVVRELFLDLFKKIDEAKGDPSNVGKNAVAISSTFSDLI